MPRSWLREANLSRSICGSALVFLPPRNKPSRRGALGRPESWPFPPSLFFSLFPFFPFSSRPGEAGENLVRATGQEARASLAAAVRGRQRCARSRWSEPSVCCRSLSLSGSPSRLSAGANLAVTGQRQRCCWTSGRPLSRWRRRWRRKKPAMPAAALRPRRAIGCPDGLGAFSPIAARLSALTRRLSNAAPLLNGVAEPRKG